MNQAQPLPRINLPRRRRRTALKVAQARKPGNLQPPGLFKKAMKGKLSLENILCTNSDFPQDVSKSCEGDPVERGLVSYHVATSLFHGHSENLYIESFGRGAKSAEVVQAILIFTICMELGWHKLNMRSNEGSVSESIFEALQKRDVESTWLVLFIHDRGSSFQTGKPWMIERSDFIESVNSWHKNPLSTSNDAAVCALATLRLATADIVDVLNSQRPCPAINQSHRVSSSLRMLKPQLEAWEKHWSGVTEGESYHEFIVSFYANHVRLFLYSFPLEASLSSHPDGSLMDNEAFWITYTSAMEMLRAATHPSMSPPLSFVHGAVHMMIAYAGVFLIKLLLSEYEKACQNRPATIQGGSDSNITVSIMSNEHSGMGRDQQSGSLLSTRLHPGPFNFQDMMLKSVHKITDGDEAHRRTSSSNNDNMMFDNMPMLDSYIFSDDEMWEATFMNAGFHVGEGVFLPGTIGRKNLY
ncbi:uncharacterized protein PAC_17707 [Phialocephala subalpina]|uniref:Transcription factor domain-containing protein n=1 Tax=Phialocephala subalpina TaxID=576137 RepID=A0A1L7XS60_9HELO|nr:uncharacterized protein PAC_17707 [Phialocephala subalpina]